MISRAVSASKQKVASPAAAKIDSVLSTEQLMKTYGGRSVVDGIDLNVKAGEIVGLLRPNGAGKTTTFFMIFGRARLGMGYLPQEESIFRRMTVEENILAILETLPLRKAERKNRCEELLHQ